MLGCGCRESWDPCDARARSSNELRALHVLRQSPDPALWRTFSPDLTPLFGFGAESSFQTSTHGDVGNTLSSGYTAQSDFLIMQSAALTARVRGSLHVCLASVWCAFRAKNVNQMEMNQCSWLVLIKASNPSRRCGCTLCPRQAGRQWLSHTLS